MLYFFTTISPIRRVRQAGRGKMKVNPLASRRKYLKVKWGTGQMIQNKKDYFCSVI